jgi:hypothetical protein
MQVSISDLIRLYCKGSLSEIKTFHGDARANLVCFPIAHLPLVLNNTRSLVDFDHKGSLDVKKFSAAMYLIENLMNGILKTIPGALSPPLLAYIKEGNIKLNGSVASLSKGEASLSPKTQRRGSMSSIDSFAMNSFSDANKMSGNEDVSTQNFSEQEWAIPQSDIYKFASCFSTLDKSRQGFLTGQFCFSLMRFNLIRVSI